MDRSTVNPLGAFTRSDMGHLFPGIVLGVILLYHSKRTTLFFAELCQLGPSIVLGHYYRQHL